MVDVLLPEQCVCGGLKVKTWSQNHDRYMNKCVGPCAQWSELAKQVPRIKLN